MKVRGIRGAITVSENEETTILAATEKLFLEICTKNEIHPDDIASVLVTTTTDLDATFPAKAIRSLPDFEYVPLLCSNEIAVPGGLKQCIRLLLHVNTGKSPQAIQHQFLDGAVVLRPDLGDQEKTIDK